MLEVAMLRTCFVAVPGCLYSLSSSGDFWMLKSGVITIKVLLKV